MYTMQTCPIICKNGLYSQGSLQTQVKYVQTSPVRVWAGQPRPQGVGSVTQEGGRDFECLLLQCSGFTSGLLAQNQLVVFDLHGERVSRE